MTAWQHETTLLTTLQLTIAAEVRHFWCWWWNLCIYKVRTIYWRHGCTIFSSEQAASCNGQKKAWSFLGAENHCFSWEHEHESAGSISCSGKTRLGKHWKRKDSLDTNINFIHCFIMFCNILFFLVRSLLEVCIQHSQLLIKEVGTYAAKTPACRWDWMSDQKTIFLKTLEIIFS